MKYLVYIFFNFQYIREKYETKVVGNGSSYCSNFSYFDENLKIKQL